MRDMEREKGDGVENEKKIWRHRHVLVDDKRENKLTVGSTGTCENPLFLTLKKKDGGWGGGGKLCQFVRCTACNICNLTYPTVYSHKKESENH